MNFASFSFTLPNLLSSHLPSVTPLIRILPWLPLIGQGLQTGQQTLPVVLIPVGSPHSIHPFALSHGILTHFCIFRA